MAVRVVYAMHVWGRREDGRENAGSGRERASAQFTQVKAKAQVNAQTAEDVPNTAMDYAAAAKRSDILDILIRQGGKGLCKKAHDWGGFTPKY